jgi:hypothetical protein
VEASFKKGAIPFLLAGAYNVRFLFSSTRRSPTRRTEGQLQYAGLLEQFSSAHVAFEQAMRFNARIFHSAAFDQLIREHPQSKTKNNGRAKTMPREFWRLQ